jgi:hypothetical protein
VLSTSFTGSKAAVLKDSLILGAAQFVGSNWVSWQLAVSGPVFSAAPLAAAGALASSYRCEALLDAPGSQVLCADGSANNRLLPARRGHQGRQRPHGDPRRGTRLCAARGGWRWRAPRRQAFGQCSYSCESKLRDDKESNVEQRLQVLLLGGQPGRPLPGDVHKHQSGRGSTTLRPDDLEHRRGLHPRGHRLLDCGHR